MSVDIAQVLEGPDTRIHQRRHADADDQGVLEEEASPDYKQDGYQDSGQDRPQDDLAHC